MAPTSGLSLELLLPSVLCIPCDLAVEARVLLSLIRETVNVRDERRLVPPPSLLRQSAVLSPSPLPFYVSSGQGREEFLAGRAAAAAAAAAARLVRAIALVGHAHTVTRRRAPSSLLGMPLPPPQPRRGGPQRV